MKTPFPVDYSILSGAAIAKEVLPEYNIGAIAECRFFSGGFNDTFRVKTSAGLTYFLRVYRRPWRTLPDILYELDALVHLQRKGCPAIRPVPRRDGNLLTEIPAPEGIRYLALFTEAPGKLVSYEEPVQTAFHYGQAVARTHNALQDFSSPHKRFHIDLDHLIDTPLRNIEPFLAQWPQDWDFLRAFAAAVRQRIVDLPASALEQGFCHGDFQGQHANVARDGTFTFFDFDCCGYGFHAYDLAVYRWALDPEEMNRWQPFLDGYRDLRPIHDLDLRAIPFFVACRYIWHMGAHSQNVLDWGIGWLNDQYFGRRLETLRTYGAQELSLTV